MRFEWSAQFVPSDLDDPTYQNIPVRESEFEAFYEMMINGQPYLGDSNHLNRDEMDILLDRGMKALLDVPIFVEGRWWGTIGFDEIKSARLWSNAEVGALLVAANVLGAAIQRQRTDAKLQEELTHRKQLIADLAAKNAELERFSYTVSHDLKSPLFTIRGFLGYLEQDALAGDQTRLRNDIQRIVGATDKMQQLLNDLLELSRIGRLVNEPRAINLNALISEVTVLLHGQLKESRAELRMNENLPEVYGDRQRISEVIQNLLDNAAKFMGDQPYPRIEIGEAGSEAGMPVLFVRDNGIGIQKEHIERVFGLFNKLDPQSEGTGIGLALVKRIVEIHGGRIWVESQPGSGSTFYFTLPSKPAPDSVL
jgi:signal transduction histidine kinase